MKILDDTKADILACETIPSFQEASILSEILLEMNEAEFYKKTAYKNRGANLKNVLMPAKRKFRLFYLFLD